MGLVTIQMFKMQQTRIVMVLLPALALSSPFNFDHAYRKDGSFGQKGISKRVGIALGEGESEVSEPLEQHKLLRRVGVLQDQEAVESQEANIRQFSSGEARMASAKVDLSTYPKEHRGMERATFDARSALSAGLNNAIQPTTIATYLTQMWAANIFQTIGWTIVGGLYQIGGLGRSATTSSFSQRRGGGGQLRRGDSKNILNEIDHKTVASILRGLAQAADNWEHRR